MSLLDPERLLGAAAGLLNTADVGERARIVAQTLTGALTDTACILYSIQTEQDQTCWVPLAISGEVVPASEAIFEKPVIFPADGMALLYNAGRLQREEYSHLHVTRTFGTIAYLPFSTEGFSGLFEVLSFGAEITRQHIVDLQPLSRLAATGLAGAKNEHGQKQELLNSIHRLTLLYDLEKSLNSTLEFNDLIELVPAKVISMIPCQAVHLWMFEGDELRLMSRAGEDNTIEVGSIQRPGEGYVADMAEEGDPLLIDDPEDERLKTRNDGQNGASIPVSTALLVPLMQEGSEVGVVEAINKNDGSAFDDDDLFFLNTMADTISSALKNASLLLSERKLEILEALVHVSSEITSTLRLERLLQIIVNSPQSVLPFERCAIALDQRGRLQLKAVSGMTSIPAGDAAVEQLRGLLAWLSNRDEMLFVRQHGDEPENADAGAREYLKKYFLESGNRALYALPLTDDQGRLGMLLYESSDPDFLETAHIEMIKVLAAQATVATRNALLYREVPLIQLLEPLVQRKQKLMSGSRGLFWLYAVLAAIAFFTLVPLPLRLRGAAVVGPQHIVTIATPVEGNVADVSAREGEHVGKGQVLGSLDDWAWKADLASAQSKYQAAVLAMESDLAQRSPKAGLDRAQADYLQAELHHAQLRFSDSELRSPIDGVVLTHDLQNAAGEHLDAGAPFAQVLDLSNAVVNVAVDEANISLVKPGQAVSIKFDSFPSRTWHGHVAIVSPEAQASGGERVFYARILLDNQSAELRAGMEGNAKIFDGYHCAGYVMLRRPALWMWGTLWNWIGW